MTYSVKPILAILLMASAIFAKNPPPCNFGTDDNLKIMRASDCMAEIVSVGTTKVDMDSAGGATDELLGPAASPPPASTIYSSTYCHSSEHSTSCTSSSTLSSDPLAELPKFFAYHGIMWHVRMTGREFTLGVSKDDYASLPAKFFEKGAHYAVKLRERKRRMIFDLEDGMVLECPILEEGKLD
jgi:hypothetical protein